MGANMEVDTIVDNDATPQSAAEIVSVKLHLASLRARSGASAEPAVAPPPSQHGVPTTPVCKKRGLRSTSSPAMDTVVASESELELVPDSPLPGGAEGAGKGQGRGGNCARQDAAPRNLSPITPESPVAVAHDDY